MKEKFFHNIIFIFFVILLLIFSLKCFLIAFRLIQQDYLVKLINDNIHLIYTNLTNQILLALIGLLLLIIVLYLIWFKQRIVQQLPSVNVATNDGEIRVSTTSLSQIILNILHGVEGVKDIKPEIQIRKSGGIKTILQLIVSPDCNIPKTAQSIQEKLKEELPKISGVEAKEIKINVNKIHYDEQPQVNSK